MCFANPVSQGWVDALAAATTAVEVVEIACNLPVAVAESMSVFAPQSWQAVVLRARYVVSGNKLVPNPIPPLFSSGPLQQTPNGLKSANAELELSKGLIVLRVHDRGIPLEILFKYNPALARAPLVETSDAGAAVRAFYRQIWSLGSGEFSLAQPLQDSVTLMLPDLQAFNRAIGCLDEFTLQSSSLSSLDVATVLGWQPLIRTLFAKELSQSGSLLRLVHLSHAYKLLGDRTLPVPGDVVHTSCKCTAVEIAANGGGRKVSCVVGFHIQNDYHSCSLRNRRR